MSNLTFRPYPPPCPKLNPTSTAVMRMYAHDLSSLITIFGMLFGLLCFLGFNVYVREMFLSTHFNDCIQKILEIDWTRFGSWKEVAEMLDAIHAWNEDKKQALINNSEEEQLMKKKSEEEQLMKEEEQIKKWGWGSFFFCSGERMMNILSNTALHWILIILVCISVCRLGVALLRHLFCNLVTPTQALANLLFKTRGNLAAELPENDVSKHFRASAPSLLPVVWSPAQLPVVLLYTNPILIHFGTLSQINLASAISSASSIDPPNPKSFRLCPPPPPCPMGNPTFRPCPPPCPMGNPTFRPCPPPCLMIGPKGITLARMYLNDVSSIITISSVFYALFCILVFNVYYRGMFTTPYFVDSLHKAINMDWDQISDWEDISKVLDTINDWIEKKKREKAVSKQSGSEVKKSGSEIKSEVKQSEVKSEVKKSGK